MIEALLHIVLANGAAIVCLELRSRQQSVQTMDWVGNHDRHGLAWPAAKPGIVGSLSGLFFILFVSGVTRERAAMATHNQISDQCQWSYPEVFTTQ
jgi:hypothetical protein